MNKLYILLATYNGENFIHEQIDSILNQSETNFRLIIRDDGSDDSTIKILTEFAQKDNRITLLLDKPGNLGPIFNFEYMLNYAIDNGANYIAFSDQDDLWKPDKLKHLLNELRNKNDIPLLVYSDLIVTDENLSITHNSFMKYQGLKHEQNNPLKILPVQNFVTGCSIMINRKLAEIALPFPKEIVMHDWWLALCAAFFGKIVYIPIPLILYRQHSANTIGAKSHSENIIKMLRFKLGHKEQQIRIRNFQASLIQASMFYNFVKNNQLLDKNRKESLYRYIKAFSPKYGRIVSLYQLLKSGIRRQTFLGNIGLFKIALSSKIFKTLLYEHILDTIP